MYNGTDNGLVNSLKVSLALFHQHKSDALFITYNYAFEDC